MQEEETKQKYSPRLDELEVMIKLLIVHDVKNERLTYSELANKVSEIFEVNVCEKDVFLLYEPSIEEEQQECIALYGSMYDFIPSNLSI